MRIASLLPSATEIVWEMGLANQLVGVSHSCDHPPEISHLPVLTSTSVPKDASSEEIDEYVRGYLGDHAALYQLNLDALAAARPDVIVSQRLCDVCAVSSDDVLSAFADLPGTPELVDLMPEVMADVFEDFRRVGRAVGEPQRAEDAIVRLQARAGAVRARSEQISRADRPRVALLEWLLPPFNSGHWNPELVEWAGGIDCLGPHGKPSHTIDWQTVREARPEVLVIASCGFSRERTLRDLDIVRQQAGFQQLLQQVNHRVLLADGKAYFSRPGPRLVDGLEALAHALHPRVHPPSRSPARIEIVEGLA